MVSHFGFGDHPAAGAAISRGTRGRAELEATLRDALIEIVPVTFDQAQKRRGRAPR
jgi:hypothetical protein